MQELIRIPTAASDDADGFTSPYRKISHIGDPFILYNEPEKKYYMYCTGRGHYPCWSSADFNTWTPLGDAYRVTEKSFGTTCYWAPEVYAYRGAYYMVYSAAFQTPESTAVNKLRHCIGLARADDPAGPFVDVYDHPLFAPGYSVIDASLLFDDDGRVYLLYSRDNCENYRGDKRVSETYGVELAADLSGTIGEPVLLATPTSPWELLSGSVIWNEGPCAIKQSGIYYLLFTANYYASRHYAVGYATATAPLGPYTKAAENPILVGDGKSTAGTGHCNLTRSPDGTEDYIVYHTLTAVDQKINPDADRTPCIDRLIFRPDGRLTVNGPTSDFVQPLPSGAHGLYRQTDGVTVASSCRTLGGAVDALTDGVIPFAAENQADTYAFAADSGSVTLTYSAPVQLHSLWVYGTPDAARLPAAVTAVVNDTYMTDAIAFTADDPLRPAVLRFAGLPADVRVQKLELYFTGGDVALGELCSIVRK